MLILSCESCEVEFQGLSELNAHNIELHTHEFTEELKKCHQCDILFTNLESFEDHKFLHKPLNHSLKEKWAIINDLPNEIRKFIDCTERNCFTCKFCRKKFFSLSFLLNHIRKNNLMLNGSCENFNISEHLIKNLPSNDLGIITSVDHEKMFNEINPSVFVCLPCSGICCGNQSKINHMNDHNNYRLRKSNMEAVMNFDDVPFNENVKVLLISQGFFQCQSCMEIFDDLQKLSSHMLDHNIFQEVQDPLSEEYLDNSDTEEPNVRKSSILFFPNRFYPTIKSTEKNYKKLNDIALNKRVDALEESSLFICKICDKRFNEIQLLGDHMCKHEIRLDEENYRIEKNNEIVEEFVDSVQTVFHVPLISLKSKNEKSDLACPKCNSNWKRNEFKELTKHILSEHIDLCDIYRCFVCKKLKWDKRLIRKHILTHESVLSEVELKSENNNNTEIELMRTSAVFFPNRFYKSIEQIERKYSSLNGIALKRRVEEIAKDSYKCLDCFAEFDCLQKIGDHMTTHEIRLELKDFEVKIDEETVKEFSESVTHFSEVPLIGHIIRSLKTSLIPCQLCEINKKWSSDDLQGITEHVILNHVKTKMYRCYSCNKIIIDSNRLVKHIYDQHEQVTGDISISCELCSKQFGTKKALEKHKEFHKSREEMKFECTVCNKKFAEQYHLKLHSNIHSEENGKHECEICKRKFRLYSSYFHHRRVHTTVKKFICDICGMALKSRNSLMGHKKGHLGIKPHKCEFCEKRFVHNGDLSVHKRLHTGERPYKCRFCDDKFVANTNLTKHMKKVHSELL